MYIITGTPFFISFYDIYFKMKKLLHIFHAVWNISIAVIGIHFAICEVRSDNSNPVLEQKSKYLNSIRVFTFFISFFCWNEINKSLMKEDTRKMENCKADNIPESSSHWRCSVEKGVLKLFCKFHRKAPVLECL